MSIAAQALRVPCRDSSAAPRRETEPEDRLDAHVDRVIAEGELRDGRLYRDRDRLRRRVASLIAVGPSGSSAGCRDAYLVACCEQRDPIAWGLVWRACRLHLEAEARHRGLDPDGAREVVSDLFADLWVDTTRRDREGGLRAWAGRGSLRGWLRAILRRRVADRRRDRGRSESVIDPDLLSSPWRGPVLRTIDREDGARLSDLLRHARHALTPREMTVLRLKHDRGWSQSAISRHLAVGEPRVSRLCHRAIDKLSARWNAAPATALSG